MTQYTYNPTNTVAAITDPFGHTTTYTYDTLGRRSSLTLPNAIATGYSYDIIGRLTGISSIPETIGYTYDDTGNRTSKTDTAGTHNYIEVDPKGWTGLGLN